MTKNRFSHITSFDDFKKERIQLYYEIKLSEKKLKIKSLELREYINPVRFISSIFQEITKPFFEYIQSFFSSFSKKKKAKKKSSKRNKNSEDTAIDSKE